MDKGWLLDSGATHHLIRDVSKGGDFVPFTCREQVTVGNGSKLSIYNMGTNIIDFCGQELMLKNILHSP